MSFGSRSLPPPTAEQKRRWELIRESGCVACRMRASWLLHLPVEIHHLTINGRHGGVRLGHEFTVGLCEWHHRGIALQVTGIPDTSMTETAEYNFGPSYARTPKAFRAEFGSDEELLKYQNELIGWTKPVRERKRKSRCTRSTKTVPRPQGGFA